MLTLHAVGSSIQAFLWDTVGSAYVSPKLFSSTSTCQECHEETYTQSSCEMCDYNLQVSKYARHEIKPSVDFGQKSICMHGYQCPKWSASLQRKIPMLEYFWASKLQVKNCGGMNYREKTQVNKHILPLEDCQRMVLVLEKSHGITHQVTVKWYTRIRKCAPVEAKL